MRTTNAKSRALVQQLIPFKANNLSAESKNGFYVVYSYKWWPLFAYSYATTKWYENSDKCSVSTSKQRGQCHPYVETIEITHEAIKQLIEGE